MRKRDPTLVIRIPRASFMQGRVARMVPEEILKLGILGVCHCHPHVMLIMARASQSVALYSDPNSGSHGPLCCWSHIPSVFSRREAAGRWEVMEITEGRSGKVSWSSCSHFVFYPLALVLPSLIAHDGLKLAILLQCPEC